jgi:hypothetical protein
MELASSSCVSQILVAKDFELQGSQRDSINYGVVVAAADSAHRWEQSDGAESLSASRPRGRLYFVLVPDRLREHE